MHTPYAISADPNICCAWSVFQSRCAVPLVALSILVSACSARNETSRVDGEADVATVQRAMPHDGDGLGLDKWLVSGAPRMSHSSEMGAPVRGNRVALLRDGDATYAAMFRTMRAAESQINLETYIFEDDAVGKRFAALLAEKATQGVSVNLIYDSVGSIDTPAEFFDGLKSSGVHVREFNPINPLKVRIGRGWRINHRDHRKILVVDGVTAFVGGVNISSVYSGSARGSRPTNAESVDHKYRWRDTHAEIEGPAVRDIQKLFIEDWVKLQGDALDEGVSFPPLQSVGNQTVRVLGGTPDFSVNPIFTGLLFAIDHARRSVHLTNAYFVPDPETITALVRAARRGVDVRLALPGVSDSAFVLRAARSYYAQLLHAGVRIYERKDQLLHAKTAVIDGVWSTVGSTNLDWRSRLHNEEVNVVIFGAEFGSETERMFADDLSASEQITPEQWARRSMLDRAREWAARLWAYWL